MKLPADFDPQRYRAAYPDVALTGMDPAEHYQRFGRIIGRNPSGKGAPPGGPAKPPKTTAEAPKQTATAPAPDRPNAIVDRPANFFPEEAIPAPAPPKSGADAKGVFTLEVLGNGVLEETRAPLALYARMFGIEGAGRRLEADIGADAFLGGGTRVENAWFIGTSALRLMITGGAAAENWAFRAYQADPTAAGELRPAGAGVQLPGLGPVFHDLELRHPLMPVILELSDTDDVTRAFALLPFPSLLPGGLHGAELRALQPEPNPMEAFWTLSSLLLRELLGAPGWPQRSIAKLSIIGSGGAEKCALLSDNVQRWLSAVFNLAVGCPSAPKRRKGSGAKAARGGGLHLLLPEDCIPTISGLVSRQLHACAKGRITSPYLVAESESHRPRWSVVLPQDWDPGPNAPALEGNSVARRGAAEPNGPPIHLAIALRPPPEPKIPQQPPPALAKSARAGPALTMVLDASDANRTGAVVRALKAATGATELDLMVRLSGNESVIRGALDSECPAGTWSAVDAGSDLSLIAAKARHDLLLTISDRVSLDGARTLQVLSDMLADAQVASASCMLLAEASIKKKVVLQPATGGLFPAGVSFATSPALTFNEPDVLQPLPDLTYPVVANTFLLTLWRTRALADLPRPSRPLPVSSTDIRVGLALADRGLRSLCTTKACAKIAGQYVRRDAIDPIGQTYLNPQHWQQLLGRVTLLRQLF
ncbi:MAG TPA: hypothetical protein VFG41_05285 [Sphingomicrobium sp.]|jgi:hypothetical protein|nr:hypothetical protein [Sphingomicrobium sp.]